MYKKILRFDLVFSYWIFIWYLLYEFKLVKSAPKLALILGLIDNLIALCLMFYYANPYINIFIFSLINFCIKVIPLWRIRKIQIKIYDVYLFIIIFILYNIWLYLNNTNFYQTVYDSFYGIQKNLPIGPISYYLKQLYQ